MNDTNFCRCPDEILWDLILGRRKKPLPPPVIY